MLRCSTCEQEKEFAAFYPDPRYAAGYRGVCRACCLQKTNEWRKQNLKRVRELENKRRRESPRPPTYRRHGLSDEQFAQLLAVQDGRCGICKTDEPEGMGQWHVDHDHDCCPGPRSCGSCVRGLLCSRCNPMIAMARDNPETLRLAAQYLENYAPLLMQALSAPV